MTDQIREQISALLDGELPQDEIGLLVRRMERDAELRRTFGSYALIGEALRAPGAHGEPRRSRLASRPHSMKRRRVVAPVDPLQAPRQSALGETSDRLGGRRQRSPCRRAAAAARFASRRAGGRRGRSRRVSHVRRRPAVVAASPTPAQSQRLAGYLVAHSQFSTPIVRRNVLVERARGRSRSSTRVSYETGRGALMRAAAALVVTALVGGLAGRCSCRCIAGRRPRLARSA